MAAPNTLSLGIEVDVAEAQQAISAINQKLEDFDKKSRNSSASLDHGVSSMQATSAALRTLEGGFSNNLRAAERFLTIVPGLADALKTAFPLVGAIAFGGALVALYEHATKLYDAFKRIQEAPQRIAEEFGALNQTLRVSNDELRVSNDRLENEIAKLQGRPGNGLKLALDEARVAADKLAESLQKDIEELQKLTEKESVGTFKGLLTNTAPTADIAKQLKEYQAKLTGITDDYNEKIDKATDPKARMALIQESSNAYKQSLNEELNILNKQYQAALAIQKVHDTPSKSSTIMSMGGVAISDNGGTSVEDQGGRLELIRKSMSNLRQEMLKLNVTQEHDADQKQKDILEAAKQSAAERKRIEEEAAKALSESLIKEVSGMGKVAEQFVQQIEAMHQKGVNSFKAFGDYMRAMQNNMATEQKKEMAQVVKDNEKGQMTGLEERGKAFTSTNDYQNEVLKRQQDIANQGLSYQEQALANSRDLQLHALDAMNAKTVEQKLSVEQRKLAIETEYLQKSHDLQVAKINADTDAQLADAEVRARKQLLMVGDDQGAQNTVNATWADEQNAINAGRDQQIAAANSRVTAQMQEAQDKATKGSTEVVQERYKSVYDAVLKQTDDFLGAVEDRTGNAWKRIADNLRKTFENALNNLISSQLAGSIAGLITGQEGNGQTGKKGGLIMGGNPIQSGLGAIPAMIGPGGTATFSGASYGGYANNFSNAYSDLPSVASASVAGPSITAPTATINGMSSLDPQTQVLMASAMSGGASDRDLSGILQASGYDPSGFGLGGAPGGTAGTFSGPVSSGGGYTPAQSSKLGGLGGLLQGGGGLLGKLGGGQTSLVNGLLMTAGGAMFMNGAFNPQKANTAGGTINTVGGAGMLGYSLASKIIPGAGPWGAAIGVGGGLLINGAERGTVGGTLEAIGGGALAGAEIGGLFGGPLGAGIGAAIGAGVGAISGLIGMLVGSPRDHVKDVVKKSYGIKIDDGTADAILNIAKQSFGGSVTLAVSSPQVRQMLSLYAQATGSQNKAASIYAQPHSYSVADAGGSLFNNPATMDGLAAGSYGGTVPTLGVGTVPGSPGTRGLSAGAPAISIQLDGKATTQVLNGQIATSAPSAVLSGYQSQRLGNASAAALFSPGLVTS